MVAPDRPPPGPRPRGLPFALRALRHRSYRLYVGAQVVSLLGSWMQSVATGWLVYRLTGSPFMLGLVAFANHGPHLLVAPLSGALLDRLDRRRVLVATQALLSAQAFALGALSLAGAVEAWHVLALSLVAGVLHAVDSPARQSFISAMVGRDDLGNAIALNSMVFNGARLVGPSVAGLVIAAFGEGPCFVANGVTYLAPVAALLAMRVAAPPSRRPEGLVEGARNGLGYAWRSRPLRRLLAHVAVMAFFGMPYVAMLPVVARDVLGGGPRALGLLYAGIGLGALGGALYLASRRTPLGLLRTIALAGGCFGLGVLGLSLSGRLALSLPVVVLTGFGMMVQMVSANTVIQSVVEERFRGRVMSLFTMAMLGVGPVGNVVAGAVAARVGTPETLGGLGALCLLATALYAARLRPLAAEVADLYGEREDEARAAALVERPPAPDDTPRQPR